MSVNWNHFKTINKKVKGFNPMENVYFPKNKAGSQKDLAVFSDFMADERSRT